MELKGHLGVTVNWKMATCMSYASRSNSMLEAMRTANLVWSKLMTHIQGQMLARRDHGSALAARCKLLTGNSQVHCRSS